MIPLDKVVEQTIKELEVYGYSIIKNFISAKVVEGLLEEVKKLSKQGSHAGHSGKPERDLDGYVYNLQNKNKKFIDLLGDSRIEHILKFFLNDPYYRYIPPEDPNYILSYYTARSSGPKLELHADTAIPSPGPFTSTMQIVFPLESFTKKNGCTIVVPGSHKSIGYVDRSLKKVTHLECDPGDLVVWDSRIWHGTDDNISGSTRWALIATLTCWWVKQRCDMPRSLPQEIYECLTNKQKTLIGFCSIPPKDEVERLNFKTGYKELKKNVDDYF